MTDSSSTIEYRESGCRFFYNRETNVLRVKGNPEAARGVIRKLTREGWLETTLRAIWFEGDPVLLLAGVNIPLYLVTVPQKETKKSPSRSFKDIVKNGSTA